MGFFDKIKKGLGRTVQVLQTDVRDLFKQDGRLVDAEFLDELFETLVRTDMGVDAAREATDEIKEQFRGRVVKKEELVDAVKAKLKALMAQDAPPIRFAQSGPTVVLFCGVNGSGKTTSIAKLTKAMSDAGNKIVLGAADTFRAAAVDQLKIWAGRLGVEIVCGPPQSDPASVAHKAVARALEVGADLCVIDTAGRLQTQTNLMNELEKIKRVVAKQIPDAPHEVFLVLDATTGQNGLSQARKFTDSVACTGIFLSKLDGTAKGGAAVAIRQKVGLPVKYVGLGESETDFAVFDPDAFVDAMFE
ncbi:MAG: signal recognition particle-docking protein FtsY [Thermoguttaceae bacterium]|nr:signal recognition particle-docking protein FtsY [Thermoguttaceae bacterium]MBQ8362955.1 signal recognition particle-docking protein FtsY [Thermoguttaceae bacterium]